MVVDGMVSKGGYGGGGHNGHIRLIRHDGEVGLVGWFAPTVGRGWAVEQK